MTYPTPYQYFVNVHAYPLPPATYRAPNLNPVPLNSLPLGDPWFLVNEPEYRNRDT